MPPTSPHAAPSPLPEIAPSVTWGVAWGPQSHRHRIGPVRVCFALLALLGWIAPPLPPASDTPLRAAPAQQGSSPAGLTYRLVDTWRDAKWEQQAGRFAHLADISSAPDGTVFALDSIQQAVHVLDRDGRPLRIFDVPARASGAGWKMERLDVGFDGQLYLLGHASEGVGRPDVLKVSPTGELDRAFVADLATVPLPLNDIAVRGDGRIYLSSPATLSLTVLAPDGTLVDTLSMFHSRCMPKRVDVAADGRVFVMNRPIIPGSSGPSPRPTVPTIAENATAGAKHRPDGSEIAIPSDACESGSIIVLSPDHRYEEHVRIGSGSDLAVGPSGAYYSRFETVHALRDPVVPLFEGWPGYDRALETQYHMTDTNLDVVADGRVFAGAYHCLTQGILILDPAAQPIGSHFLPGLDRPSLEGPVYPLRMDVSDDLVLLQGRFNVVGTRPFQSYHHITDALEPQSVQRWTRHGQITGGHRLRSQAGLCGYNLRQWDWALDVAADGPELYSLDRYLLLQRTGDGFPNWAFTPEMVDPDAAAAPNLTAVAAGEDRVAVLDSASGKIYVLDRDRQLIAAWPVAVAGGPAVLPADIALDDRHVYVSDLGHNRLLVFDHAGTLVRAWGLHDGPQAIDVGPGGEVFVLGRGKAGYRYGPDGTLVATWPMPDPTAHATGIGVGAESEVYVSFVQGNAPSRPTLPSFSLVGAGVWVFEPAVAPPAEPPPPTACVTWPDKRATTTCAATGNVEVVLEVHGRCPGLADPAQVLFVLDTSRSMGSSNAIDRARSVILALLGGFDGDAVEAGLIGYGDGAARLVPMTRDYGRIRAAIAAATADGDTRLTPAIELARTDLAATRRAGLRQVAVVVTDGAYKDGPIAALRALQSDGVDVYAVITPSEETTQGWADAFAHMLGDASKVLHQPDTPQLADLVRRLTNARTRPEMFASIDIRDVIPPNFDFVPGSAVPAAAFDAASNTLSWHLDAVPAATGLRLSYRLQPLETTGTWPTNVEATAAYRDATGFAGRLTFPVPQVRIPDPGTSRCIAYLPSVVARGCLLPSPPLDVLLVVDTSSTMDEPGAADGRSKLALAKSAAQAFVARLDMPADRVGLIAFDDSALEIAPLMGDRDDFFNRLATLSTRLGTRIDRGLGVAGQALARGGRNDARAAVILLTDGLQNQAAAPNSSVLAEADRLKARGALVYTIGLGSGIDRPLLRDVASAPTGFIEAPTAGDLESVYRAISERLSCVP